MTPQTTITLTAEEYHCGMCELSWLTPTVPSHCPHCDTNEIETKEAALSHHTLEHEWYGISERRIYRDGPLFADVAIDPMELTDAAE